MKFISITKPGIIFGNIITVLGGYFLASHGHYNFSLLIAILVGMSLVIAAGCVLNNYIDQDIDRLMERTKNRVLVTGLISGKVALLYAILLGVTGFLVLYLLTNHLTAIIAFIGFFVYVAAYSLWLKRLSIYGTIIGGIAGAVPPVVGYCAVTNHLDLGALLLFLILFLWQIPHFYAISIYRLRDFSAAALPILPVKKSIYYTKMSMLVYIIAFVFAAIMPTLFGYTGALYFVFALASGIIWCGLAIGGLSTQDDLSWSRKMFIVSLINITILCAMMVDHG